ncbi:MAG TPA: hypothetical protein VK989_20220 [Polyangia bacterium]|jgi:hypothetical protein|nr:hypothetical protein [Polyangia bacterium]
MSMGSPPGMDEYQRLIAERAAAQKRKRTIYGVVLVVAIGAGGFWWKQQKDKANAAQAILDAAGRFAEKDKTEMGAFWSCAFGSEIDVGMLQSAQQIQQKIEGAYFTQQKTFSDHLTTECVPKLERARSAVGALVADMPAELKPSLDKYVGALPRMQTGIEVYAEKIKGRGAVKDVDQSIQEVGGAFSPDATAESVAFEKFLVCAIPDLDKKKDIQGVLEYLAATCKDNAVDFMTGVREKCGPLVTNVDKDGKPAPSKTFKANTKKLYEEDQRQLQAWDYCAKRSRKGKKQLDLEDFLTAAGDYMESRADLVQTAREAAAKIQGQPLPAAAKKAAPGAAE